MTLDQFHIGQTVYINTIPKKVSGVVEGIMKDGVWILWEDERKPLLHVAALHEIYEAEPSEERREMHKHISEVISEIDFLTNMRAETGRPGCTYGDTDFDSVSVHYGIQIGYEYLATSLSKVSSRLERIKKQFQPAA